MIIKKIKLDIDDQKRLRQLVAEQELVLDRSTLSEPELQQQLTSLSERLRLLASPPEANHQLKRQSWLSRHLVDSYVYGMGLVAILFLGFITNFADAILVFDQAYQGLKGQKSSFEITCIAEPWTESQGVLPINGLTYISNKFEPIGVKVVCDRKVYIHIIQGAELRRNLFANEQGILTNSLGELVQFKPHNRKLEFKLYMSEEKISEQSEISLEPSLSTSELGGHAVLWHDSLLVSIQK